MKTVEASLTTKVSRIFGCIREKLSNPDFHSNFLMKTLCYLEVRVMKASLVSFRIVPIEQNTFSFQWRMNKDWQSFVCNFESYRHVRSTSFNEFSHRWQTISELLSIFCLCQHNKRWLLLVILIMSTRRRQVCRNNYCTTTFFNGRTFETCWLIKSDASLWNCRKFLMAIKSC